MQAIWLALLLQAQAGPIRTCVPAGDGRTWVCAPAGTPMEHLYHHASQPSQNTGTDDTVPTAGMLATQSTGKNSPTNSLPRHNQPNGTVSTAGIPPRERQLAPSAIHISKDTAPRHTPRAYTTHDAAIRLLYQAPATLPAQSTADGRLRRAPTTIEELQNPRLVMAKPVLRHHEKEAQSDQSASGASDAAIEAASQASTITDFWTVRLLGTARLNKARMLLDTLPDSLANCSLHTSELGELTWHEIHCGSFASRKQAQAWLEGVSVHDPLLPVVIHVKGRR